MTRIYLFDEATQQNSIWNAQKNLNQFLKENITVNMQYLSISDNVQYFLSELYPFHYWFVYTYKNVSGSASHSWNCENCFAMLNVNGSYHILVAAIPRASVGNSTLVQDSYFTAGINKYNNA